MSFITKLSHALEVHKKKRDVKKLLLRECNAICQIEKKVKGLHKHHREHIRLQQKYLKLLKILDEGQIPGKEAFE
jgi:hypothetical protein